MADTPGGKTPPGDPRKGPNVVLTEYRHAARGYSASFSLKGAKAFEKFALHVIRMHLIPIVACKTGEVIWGAKRGCGRFGMPRVRVLCGSSQQFIVPPRQSGILGKLAQGPPHRPAVRNVAKKWRARSAKKYVVFTIQPA